MRHVVLLSEIQNLRYRRRQQRDCVERKYRSSGKFGEHALRAICSAGEIFGLASIPLAPHTPKISSAIGKVNPVITPGVNTVFSPSPKTAFPYLLMATS